MIPQTNMPAAGSPAQQSAGPQPGKVAGVHDVEAIAARLRAAQSLPELLAVSFDAFEAIRVLARGSEGVLPALFAAFMTVADTAVDGREAITIAPSLSPAPSGTLVTSPPAVTADIDTITDALAALGALLGERLAHAANRALVPGDRAACQEAAKAGRRIHQLTAREQ
jgi:hypothetical protein